ncbi:MAG: nicotinate phosphoribosyltransferase [Gemmatimonadales bacterium]|nr:nicotinate phosphoribosyltransferase [Gemmatimonadales bacterium]
MPVPPVPGEFRSGPLHLHDAALFTDLYELTMGGAFHREGMRETATFSLFARRLPPSRGFVVAAGLEDALEYLGGLRFTSGALEYLHSLGRFDAAFLDHLVDLRFTGEVRAVAEGTVVFRDEPILEVTGPAIEAQLVETALLNICHLQCVLASKAARVAIAARGRAVAEFGLRRSHGSDAGLKAARCAWIAGCESTSDVLAGKTYGLPLSGTMAHSFVTAFPDELEAFRAYARAFPDAAVLLLDSYDTVEGAKKAVTVARELAAAGQSLAGVRLDSGDLLILSRQVRRIFDEAGFPEVRVLVSGGLDEHDIERLLAQGAPIDAFGIGTRLNVSADAPSLDLVYKLVRYGDRDVLKLSEGKETWVGAKAIYRMRDADGKVAGDVLALEDEAPPADAGESLLQPVMRNGELLRPHPPLAEVRRWCGEQIAALPDGLRRLAGHAEYPVRPSDGLRARQAEAVAKARAMAP